MCQSWKFKPFCEEFRYEIYADYGIYKACQLEKSNVEESDVRILFCMFVWESDNQLMHKYHGRL